MEIRDYEAFITVAEELHFGRAAERLLISQPPLSNRIRQIERSLGLELFNRTTRAVELTSAGQRFLPAAREVMHHHEEAQRVAKAIRTGELGTVRLGFAGVSSQQALPILSRAVKDAYPDIDLQIQSQTYVYTAVEQLRQGSLDLAFSRLPTHPDLEARVIQVEELLCALPDDHPLADRDEINLSELAQEKFVSLTEDQGSVLQATMASLCISAGFRPQVIQYAPDSATVLALVAAGIGITITLSSVAETRPHDVAYKKLANINPSHMFATLAWRRNDPSQSLRHVLEISQQVLPTPDLSEFENNPFLKSIGPE
ncbi:LysR family transcriptional regulator [Corynebacterium comes]|uniref:Hca operon transcriptional activator n=1 Tax=Corynebacterium comes TaxID=2675218 RepID=A0A6B8W1A0_9CORY|nr:LysR family transcriptional regulator [Corynebacterium comes]QGU03400.1 Hca operon transcriptional activator [Corynebacterium comes]